MSGEIILDREPGEEFRTQIHLDLMEKDGDKMVKTGTWTYESGVNYTKSESARQEQTTMKLQNKTLSVVTTLVSFNQSLWKLILNHLSR